MSQKKPSEAEGAGPAQMSMMAYSGPLPPAEQLEHYEKLYGGAAKLLFEKFAEERTHRMNVEKSESDKYFELAAKEQKNNFLGNISGQLLSAAICLVGLGACVYLAMNGHTWEAISVVAIPFAGIIRAMRSGKDGKKQ
jgi:uncharacterized membrane protein